ncbi:MAG: NUDIX domain-containing protein [Finegoldia sp.]|nr:NUDIX domain-containing protein [Finegoldia sp.]
MKTVLLNMIKINSGSEVLVLDKVKKQGWEGLTFPGGHVEEKESIYESTVREAKEETGLDVYELDYKGMIEWYDLKSDERQVGYLYETDKFSGDLVEENVEGKLFFVDYEKFKSMEGMSDSMDEILSIYEGTYREIIMYFNGDDYLFKKSFR